MRWAALALTICPIVSAIWPAPSSYVTGHSTLWIDEATIIEASTTPQASDTKRIIDEAIKRTRQCLFKQSFVPWKFHARNATYEPSAKQTSQTTIKKVELQFASPNQTNVMKTLAGELDESYNLTISADGNVVIIANSSIGVVRGLTSFTQLFYQHSDGSVYTPYVPVKITDRPKFAHRGLNLDLARNYFPVRDLKRTIDAMAYNKFNRFHLHITDAQSWPLEIPAIPELAQKGAYHPSLTYTPADLREVQIYGGLQGVQVYLEIDMPGHTSSIWYSHPDLIASFNEQPNWSTYSAEPPSGTLKLNSSKVSNFTDKLFADLLPRVSPYTAYFHTGGDEVNFEAYLNDDTVNSKDILVLQPLMQKFIDRNHAQIRAAGLTPIVWEEMVFDFSLELGKDVVVQTWQGSAKVAMTVGYGYKAIAGNSDYWYLDCGQGQWLNSVPNGGSTSWPYNDCPRKNWRLMYSYDPLVDVPEDQAHLVIGGEAHIWTEQIDPANLDRTVWPRASAVAEILWSGAKDAQGQNRSQVEAAPRLSEMRERLIAMGVMAEPLQMPFCLMGRNQCNL